MRSLIYIKVINEGDFDFDSTFVDSAKLQSPGLMVLDLDNLSGTEMFQYAQQLLVNSTERVCVVEFLSDATVGKIAQWLENAMKKFPDMNVFIIGTAPPFLKVIERKYPQCFHLSASRVECLATWKELSSE